MKIYLVGGAVRDALLGLPVQDRDWVVVGASPTVMLDKGYTPIGRDFPVFLHPKTHEEYALARTERKTARGYHGFSFCADEDVTLVQDLSRRDLTINAIAQDADGTLIDPYHGQRDAADKVLRHVTLAFREDPVRILRVARFAARLTDFVIAPETLILLRGMVANGEADSLVAERVWQELAKGLMEVKPSRMFGVLADCGLLARLLPSLVGNSLAMEALDTAAVRGFVLAVRFATLQLPNHVLKAPSDCEQLTQVVTKLLACYQQDASAEKLYACLDAADAWRQPVRFGLALEALKCVHPDIATQPLAQALEVALAVATQPIAQAAIADGLSGEHIGERIAKARIQAIALREIVDAPPPPTPRRARAV